MTTTTELIASGHMLLDDNDNYIILQEHFSDGTLIIDTAGGNFKLYENIEFKPNPVGTLVTKADAGLVPPYDPTANDIIALDASLAGRPLLSQYDLDGSGQRYDPAAFGLGFFSAIAIPADNVTLDLNGYTLEQSEEHALLQRFYANIELGSAPFIPGQGPHDFGSAYDPAENVTILSGTLGLSSHHGIHGNSNENVTIQGINLEDFEVAAIALNGANNAVIEDVTATNRKDVPVLGTFSNALFIVPYINYLASWDAQDGDIDLTLDLPTGSISIYDIQADLGNAINNVYEDVIGLGSSINANDHVDEFNLFHNSFGVVDGNAYGILTGAEGVQVDGYPYVDVSNPSTDITIKDVEVTNLHSAVSEIPALANSEGKAVTDPIGAVFMVRNDPNGVSNTLSTNDLSGSYVGNILSNAQLMVAIGIEAGAFEGSFLDVSRNTIDSKIIEWAESGAPLSDLVGTFGLDDGIGDFDWFYNGDTMFHVNKGTIGFKLDGSEDLSLNNLTVEGLKSFGLPGSSEGGDYEIGHPKQSLSGYNGTASIAFSFAGTEDVVANGLEAKNIFSDWGEVFGIRIFNGSQDITIDNSSIQSLNPGVLGQADAPNQLAEDYPLFVGDDTSGIIVNTEIASLDFEAAGLSAGTKITDQFTGLTISADGFGAMIFDPANPTGGDTDLASDNLGNVLILSEDGDSSDPDDDAKGGTFYFTWDDLVNIDSIGLLDVEESGGSITLYGSNESLLGSFDISNLTNDGGTALVDINLNNVSRMEVTLIASGAITDVQFF